MKVLWFTNVLMPEFAQAINASTSSSGGWMMALADAIRVYAPEIQLTIATRSPKKVNCLIGEVYYVGLGVEVMKEADQLVKSLNPDIIHIHGSEVIAQQLSNEILSDDRTMLTIQGVINGLATHYTGGLTRDDIRVDRSLFKEWLRKTGMFQIQRRWAKDSASHERRVFSLVKNIAGRTGWDKDWARMLNPDSRYFEIGELIRKEIRSRNNRCVRGHSIYCSAAMAYPLKGAHWLLKAVAALKRKYPDITLRVADAERVNSPKKILERIRCGDYHKYLNRIMREYGIEDRVVLLGRLSASEVANELEHAELFCLPSLCENSPNSLGEAMLSGVPCIATYVGGIPSILENGNEGLLVPSGDPAALAGAIDRLFSDKVLARKYAEAAYSTAVKRYAPETVVEQLKSAYQAISKTAKSTCVNEDSDIL